MQYPKSNIKNQKRKLKNAKTFYVFKCVFFIFYFLFLIFNIGWAEEFRSLPKKTGSIKVPSVIADLQIKGNRLVSDREIMEVVFSRVGETLSEEKIKLDQKAIYALGYFSDVSTSFEVIRSGTRVIFMVAENPWVEVVTFEGNSIYSSAELFPLLKTKTREILNYRTLQEDIQKINDHYKENGYLLARVTDVETPQNKSILKFKIVEGLVESIALEGNEVTHDYVVLRELKTKAGRPLNEKTLKADIRRIFNLGFFSEINPVFEPGTTKDKIILLLKIKESRSSTVNFGGGYGEREGWFGFIDLSINNLMGTAQGLLIRGQVGQELSTYQFKYFNPWFFPERFGERSAFTLRRWLTIGRDIYLTEQDAVYNGFDLSLGKPWKEIFDVSWSIGSENVSPYGTSSFEAYRSDTIGLTLAYDTRDFWLNPKEGRYYSFGIRQGWKYTSTLTNFFKFSLDFNHYYPLFENQVFASHLGLGYGIGDVPIGEKFWAGGANTIRGYYPSQAKRANRKLLFNFEYRLNFSELFQGVFFFDWGDAWDQGAPVPSQFLLGWGPGLRINTPLGPIRLDYGVGGGKAFGEGIMHFSIGQAF